MLDFIGYFRSWNLVDEKKVPEKVLLRLKRKIDEVMYKKMKDKKTTIPGCTVYDESEKFFYKATESSWKWIIEKQRFSSTDKIKIYRKSKKK